jgi:DNA-binding transcriptional regulator YiaG
MVGKIQRLKWDGPGVLALRRHMRLTQAGLAEELGTRQQTISDWETGMYQPRGTSATLLTLVAERSGFKYTPKPKKESAD